LTPYKRALSSLATDDLDLTQLFEPANKRLDALLEKKKRSGEGLVSVPEQAADETGNVIDLMAILKQSLKTHAATNRAQSSTHNGAADHNGSGHKRRAPAAKRRQHKRAAAH
jgi:non-homologous end joining protein Ku